MLTLSLWSKHTVANVTGPGYTDQLQHSEQEAVGSGIFWFSHSLRGKASKELFMKTLQHPTRLGGLSPCLVRPHYFPSELHALPANYSWQQIPSEFRHIGRESILIPIDNGPNSSSCRYQIHSTFWKTIGLPWITFCNLLGCAAAKSTGKLLNPRRTLLVQASQSTLWDARPANYSWCQRERVSEWVSESVSEIFSLRCDEAGQSYESINHLPSPPH